MKERYSGMTILETSISLMVLGIAILGILSGIYMASRITTRSRNYINAIQLAESKIEEIKGLSYSEIDDEEEQVGEGLLPYGTIGVSVDEKVEGKEIKVDVRWIEKNINRGVRLVTFVRKE